MSPVRYVLRDLEGVAELEAMLDRIHSHRSPLWAPEVDEAVPTAIRLIGRHFGLSLDGSSYEFNDEWKPGEPVWRRSVWVGELEEEGDELEAWRKHGWDVARSDGRLMRCLAFFDGVILGALAGFGGRLPDALPSDDEIQRRAGDFEAKLLAEAEQFRKGRS